MRIFTVSPLIVLFAFYVGCSRGRSITENNSVPGNAVTEQQPSSTNEPGFEDSKLAALDALSDLKQLLTSGGNFRQMGFDSLEQIDEASLSEPAAVYTVGLDQLREYSPSADPQSLLVDTRRLVYPVIAGGRGRTLITLEMKAGKWHFVSFGDQRVASNLVRVRKDKSSAPGGPPASSYFVIQVKTLFLTFLGNRPTAGTPGAEMKLVPLNGSAELKMSPGFRDNSAYLLENPNFNAEKGGAKKASDVFGNLSTAAKKVDGSKPF